VNAARGHRNLKMKMDHINVVVEDMEASVRFYSAVFGMQVSLDCELGDDWFQKVVGIPGARARCVFLDGDAPPRLELLEYLQPLGSGAERAAANQRGLRHFAIEVNDIEKTMRVALAHGCRAVSEIVEVPRTVLPQGKRLVYLEAPDDVLLELAQYGG